MNDPDDPGGETNFGISKRAHPEVDIANLTEELAAEIYKADYWNDTGDALDGHKNDGLTAALFDFAINSGSDRAVKELQKAVGVAVDGRIGPATRAAVDQKAFDLLAFELCNRRKSFLWKLIIRNPSMKKFAKGWARRVSLFEAALKRGDFRE